MLHRRFFFHDRSRFPLVFQFCLYMYPLPRLIGPACTGVCSLFFFLSLPSPPPMPQSRQVARLRAWGDVSRDFATELQNKKLDLASVTNGGRGVGCSNWYVL